MKISTISKITLVFVAILLASSIFVPIWRIELDAPQYPEGLFLSISANGIGGNVETINGLNHYIGMKTLHSEDFIEFTVLPYILAFFAVFALLTFLLATRKLLYALLISFTLFGTLSMIDFYRWNYDYGHDLDPTAAIKVPGMAYQPPLIGYKQLLNFGAYSIPDIGGWFLIVSGLLLLIIAAKEANFFAFFKKNIAFFFFFGLFFSLSSCSSKQPEAIKVNADHCEFCKMSISQIQFASELITQKGRVYKFDDLLCMLQYYKANQTEVDNFYVMDFEKNTFLEANKAFFVRSPQYKSPMGGNMICFDSQTTAQEQARKWQAELLSWQDVNPN